MNEQRAVWTQVYIQCRIVGDSHTDAVANANAAVEATKNL